MCGPSYTLHFILACFSAFRRLLLVIVVAQLTVISTAQGQVIPEPSVEVTAARSRALLIYKRLTGINIPIDSAILLQMEALIAAGDVLGASRLVTNDKNFYNSLVRDFAAKMSTRDETVQTPLNDFIATVIGVVRDDIDAKLLLSGNFYYQGDPAKVSGARVDLVDDIIRSNNHYVDISSRNLFDVLMKVDGQKIVDGADNAVASPDVAGLLTTRAWVEAHAVDGTNRRIVEYTFREFLCIPMSEAADNTGPDNMIRRDVDRYPGGSNEKFQLNCRSCHTIMDGLSPAFARMDFDDNIYKNATVLPPNGATNNADEDGNNIIRKYNQNTNVFPGGYTVTNTNWVNNAVYGANIDFFGWRGPLSGSSMKQYGEMIANSKAFSRCMSKRVFKTVCRKDPFTQDEKDIVSKLGEEFEAGNYSLKELFAKMAIRNECIGK